MPHWVEQTGSRASTIQRKGKRADSTHSRTYRLFGYTDDSTVHSAANNYFSANRFVQIGDYTLMVESYTVSHVAGDVWDVTAQYVKTGADDDTPQPFRRTRSFDTGGATAHMTQAHAERRYGSGAPDQLAAINIDGETVKGVDYVIPSLSWTETYDVPAVYVTQAYIKTVAQMTGTVNSAAFKTFLPGEVLFMGASGNQEWDSEKGDGPWSLSYKFIAQPNAGPGQTWPALTIGSISNIQKNGHEYLWVVYEPAVDAGTQSIIRRPKYVYVNEIYRKSNFAGLGIGT